MKSLAILTALLGLTSAAQMKACSSKDMNGNCNVETSFGKTTGSWKSYKWSASTNMCVKICNSCTELGWRCQSYSNNDTKFNKFIIFNWAGGDGPEQTTCC